MDALRINSHLTIPRGELIISAARSGGPGGQNVNKVNTKVTIRWNVQYSRVLSDHQRWRLLAALSNKLTNEGELVISSDETRSQDRNQSLALEKLKNIISAALQTKKKRRATKPSAASKERRIRGKTKRATIKKMRARPNLGD